MFEKHNKEFDDDFLDFNFSRKPKHGLGHGSYQRIVPKCNIPKYFAPNHDPPPYGPPPYGPPPYGTPPYGPPPYGPPPYGTPPYGPPPPPGFSPFGPPHMHRKPGFFPFKREEFREFKDFLILKIIKENQGINAYELQENYHIPRGNILRTLEKLEEKEYVRIEEKEEGRQQKLYFITEKGNDYLEKIKEKWSDIFTSMSEHAPPEIYGNPFKGGRRLNHLIRTIDNFNDKEDAEDFFKGMRSQVKGFIKRLQRRMERINSIKTKVDSVINGIEQMDSLDKDKLKKLVEDLSI